ncbi:MAG: DUF4241 domain-containing protein [Cardiobacteriaceae bacterium]|nr:DUF4241 domain-containing protein [Cardiobacteriaceae bacterium]
MYTLNLADYQSAFQTQTLFLGTLRISSGQLLLCDPFIAPYESPLPFLHPVPCGEFKVEAAIKRFDNGDKRIAYVRVVFREEPIGYMEMGVTDESLYESFEADEFTGAISETGYLALSDAKALNALPAPQNQKACELYEQQLDTALAATHVNTYRHTSFTPAPKSQKSPQHPPKTHPFIAFTAGWGEGLYPLFFGYTHEPQEDESLLPVCAVIALRLED